MIELNGNFKFTKIALSGDDYFVLTQMYLPLIGVDGLAVYLAINNLIDDEASVRKLLDILGFDNVGIFERALYKLEGIGLVNEYSSKTKGMLIAIIPPLSAKSFLNHHLLKTYLTTQIGQVEYQNLRSKVFVTKVKGYEEVTKRFDEVFKPTKHKTSQTFINDLLTKEDNIRLRNDRFDYLIFKMQFTEEELSSDVLDDQDFENEILRISFQYQLDEVDMKKAVVKSILSSKDLNYDNIALHAGYVFQNKTPTGAVSFQTKDAQIYYHNLTSEEMQILGVANSTAIADILASVSGGKGSLADLRDFNKLMDVTGLPIGVVNVLIFHLANQKEGANLSFTYIEKVARNWMKAGVKTTEDALVYLRENVKGKSRTKKIANEPEWMKNPQVSENKELSQEELDEAEQLKKKVFGGRK